MNKQKFKARMPWLHRPTPSKSASKAYLRNFGKGELEYANGTLKFYLLKGMVLKRKELAKSIPLAETVDVCLEGKELTVNWKDSVERFVVEDASFAGLILEQANKPSTTSIETLPAPTMVAPGVVLATKTESSKRIVDSGDVFEVVDSAFDLLRSLHGNVNWDLINGSLKQLVKSAKRVGEDPAFVDFDASWLTSAVNSHDVESIKSECLKILENVCSNHEATVSVSGSQSFAAVVLIYCEFNDIFLGSLVGDEKVAEEVSKFSQGLGNFAKTRNLELDIEGIERSVGIAVAEHGRQSHVDNARAIFRAQLKKRI